MTVAVAVLGVLLAVALLLVIALLRSHAEILRRLAALESALDAGAVADGSVGSRAVADGSAGGRGGLAHDPSRAGGPATDITGVTLSGDSVELPLGAGAPDTLLAFMGTGCHACAVLWEGLDDEALALPAGARLIVVTKGPERERLAQLLELVPAQADVIMSTRAWTDFGISSTPHFVLVRRGEIAGRGSATSWQQITTFLSDADEDERIHAARSLGTSERAARAERTLADAGIGPDHPSLYPSRLGTAQDAATWVDPFEDSADD